MASLVAEVRQRKGKENGEWLPRSGGAPSRVWFNDGSGVFDDTGQSLGRNERNWGVALTRVLYESR